MDIEGTAKSFDMRFGRKCTGICFVGMGIPILKGANTSIAAAVSVGGCAAAAPRRDGRFTAEFDDGRRHITSNTAELMYHRDEPMLDFLERLRCCGVMLGGADILFKYNTELYGGYEELLMSALPIFCPKTVPIALLKGCLSNGISGFAGVAGKKDTLLFSNGEGYRYIKFSGSLVKLVLCCVSERNNPQYTAEAAVINAALGISSGDYVRFGQIITEEYRKSIEKCGAGRKTRQLFELASGIGDALGCGVLENGGIFAVLENKKVDTFIHGLHTEYENCYGAAPDFYVTDTENSGINTLVKP